MTAKQKKMLLRIIAAAVFFVGGIAAMALLPEISRYSWAVELAFFGTAYLLIGWDVIWKALRNILHGQVFDENFLMAVASIGAMIVGEYIEGAAVMLFYRVGELFESVAVGKSRRSIAEMVDINPEHANLELDGAVEEVDPEDVQCGDIIVIRPGERIPLDGVVVTGSSGVNTAALTGESALRDISEGDEVISGCLNTTGLLRVRVSRPYSDSTVARILDLVENSTENKAKTENFITKFARVYTPVVVFSAAVLAVLPPLFMMLTGGDAQWNIWIYRALTFLVVSCPCALVISVPLSYFGGIGGASKHGIMVKGANYLEALNKAEVFVFDKTGTLTKGSFVVSEIHPIGMTEEELLGICAAAERYSTHPIAVSIVNAAGDVQAAYNAEELAGLGIRADVGGREVHVGNEHLMAKCGAECVTPESAGTAVHCAVDGVYCGYLIISDEIKNGAADAVADLKRQCGARTIMLTGDRRLTGEIVAKEVGMDEVHTELLPDGKVAMVEELYSSKRDGRSLVFVGDGMNDAPALARADVGIAMGGLGSDAAIEAADIVLMNDNIEKLPVAVRIARKTHNIVVQNIVFALGIKVLVLLLSAAGLTNMWAAVFADVGVSVLAILNAMRAMKA